jgi:virulence-associated protein VagC
VLLVRISRTGGIRLPQEVPLAHDALDVRFAESTLIYSPAAPPGREVGVAKTTVGTRPSTASKLESTATSRLLVLVKVIDGRAGGVPYGRGRH